MRYKSAEFTQNIEDCSLQLHGICLQEDFHIPGVSINQFGEVLLKNQTETNPIGNF